MSASRMSASRMSASRMSAAAAQANHNSLEPSAYRLVLSAFQDDFVLAHNAPTRKEHEHMAG